MFVTMVGSRPHVTLIDFGGAGYLGMGMDHWPLVTTGLYSISGTDYKFGEWRRHVFDTVAAALSIVKGLCGKAIWGAVMNARGVSVLARSTLPHVGRGWEAVEASCTIHPGLLAKEVSPADLLLVQGVLEVVRQALFVEQDRTGYYQPAGRSPAELLLLLAQHMDELAFLRLPSHTREVMLEAVRETLGLVAPPQQAGDEDRQRIRHLHDERAKLEEKLAALREKTPTTAAAKSRHRTRVIVTKRQLEDVELALWGEEGRGESVELGRVVDPTLLQPQRSLGRTERTPLGVIACAVMEFDAGRSPHYRNRPKLCPEVEKSVSESTKVVDEHMHTHDAVFDMPRATLLDLERWHRKQASTVADDAVDSSEHGAVDDGNAAGALQPTGRDASSLRGTEKAKKDPSKSPTRLGAGESEAEESGSPPHADGTHTFAAGARPKANEADSSLRRSPQSTRAFAPGVEGSERHRDSAHLDHEPHATPQSDEDTAAPMRRQNTLPRDASGEQDGAAAVPPVPTPVPIAQQRLPRLHRQQRDPPADGGRAVLPPRPEPVPISGKHHHEKQRTDGRDHEDIGGVSPADRADWTQRFTKHEGVCLRETAGSGTEETAASALAKVRQALPRSL